MAKKYGGKRTRKHLGGRKHKKGGQFGEVINQALVPASLWVMQNKYSKKQGLRSLIPGFSKTRKANRSRKMRRMRK